jgi:protein TonB
MVRFAVGMPRRKQSRWQGWLASLLAHLLLLTLIIIPAVESDNTPLPHAQGAGGPGPAGGGGGGLGDAGAPRLRFVQITPPAAPATVAPAAAPPTPPVPTPVKPTVPPPPIPVTPAPPAVSAPASPSASTSEVAGAGTGLGKTGGAGTGPGSGGGVGSGEGPGRGSGVGPGTGGGNAKNFPPTPKQFFLPPLPAPASLRGFRLTAWFDVDSTGKATLLRFTPSPDRDYNNRLRETLLAMRFRPAVRPDGVPVRDTVDVEFVF